MKRVDKKIEALLLGLGELVGAMENYEVMENLTPKKLGVLRDMCSDLADVAEEWAIRNDVDLYY